MNEIATLSGGMGFEVKFTPGNSWNALATRLPNIVRNRLQNFLFDYLDGSGRYIQESVRNSYRSSGIVEGTHGGLNSIKYVFNGRSPERASISFGIQEAGSASTSFTSAKSQFTNAVTQYMPALEFGTHNYPPPGKGRGGPNLGRIAWWLSFRDKSFIYDPSKPVFAQYNEQVKQARAYNKANKDNSGFEKRETKNIHLARLLGIANAIRRKGTRKFAFMQKVIKLDVMTGKDTRGATIRDTVTAQYQLGIDEIEQIAMERLLNDVATDLGQIKQLGVARKAVEKGG